MRHVITLCLCYLIVHMSTAQQTWNLQECITRAQEQSLNVQQSLLAVQDAEISETISKHSRYPSLNAGSNVNWNFGRSIDPTSNTFVSETFFSNNISLNTGVTLYNGGAINNSIKQSEIDTKAAMQDALSVKQNIALSVSSFYLNLLFAKENVAIAEKQLALAQDQLKQINILINAGSRPENERLDLEAQVSSAEQSLVQAQNTVDINTLNLKQLLLLDADVDFDVVIPDNTSKFQSDNDLLTFEEVYATALNTQPNIKAGELREESAAVSEKIAKAALLPSLSFGASLGSNYSNKGLSIDGFNDVIQETDVVFQGMTSTIGFPQQVPVTSKTPYFTQLDENLSYGVGFGLNIPIYNNYQNRGNIERAKIGIDNAKINQRQQTENLKIDIQQALADMKAAKRSYAAAKKTDEAQKMAFNNASKRFDLGAISTFDLNNSRTAMENAAVNLLIAKYDYIFRSKIIDFYLGKPLKMD